MKGPTYRMKHLRMILAALLLPALLLSLVCCTAGQDPGTQPEAPATDAPTEAPTEPATEPPKADREGWALEGVPAYQGGYLGRKVYSCGGGLTENEKISKMQIAGDTTAAEFADYRTLCERCGFVCETWNEIEKNRYACYSNGTSRVWAYYIAYLSQATFILDPASCALSDFCAEPAPGASREPVLYAYGFNTTGQLILVHNSDNSWFINDGATSSIDSEKLYAFLREKSGLAAGEKLVISLWYVTHGHSDHFPGVANMIRKHPSEIDLQRVMWNFPDPSVISAGSSSHDAQLSMQKMVQTNYPDVKYLKCHTGMDVKVGDVELVFLITHEDNMTKFVSGEFDDYNNTSSVAMLYFGGKAMFLPGDCKSGTIDGSTFLCRAYSAKTFGCSLMQVSHHGYNKINSLYDSLYPTLEYVLFENTYAEAVARGTGSGPDVYARMGAERSLFSDKTYAIRVVDGKLVAEQE